MARFLAVVFGAAVGFAVVWFAVVQPRQAARHAASESTTQPISASTPDAKPDAAAKPGDSAKPSEAAKPTQDAPTPAPRALTNDELANAIADLTSDDDVIRGSAIEAWSKPMSKEPGALPLITAHPRLMAALAERLATMPPDRLTVYIEAWGPDEWWIRNFPVAHGRYAAWRADADDNIWIPYAYDQLDRFDPVKDIDSIRAILDVLVNSNVAKARLRSLECTAHYLGQDARPYALSHLRDPDNKVARLAWIIAAKTGDVDASGFDWKTGPRFVGVAVLYALAIHHPDLANEACDRIEQDPVIHGWYEDDIPLIRQRAAGASDRETIVTINTGSGPARVFEEAIRVDELLSGEFPQYVQE